MFPFLTSYDVIGAAVTVCDQSDRPPAVSVYQSCWTLKWSNMLQQYARFHLYDCSVCTQPMIQLEKPVLTGTMPVVWPTILDLGRDECKRILRKLGESIAQWNLLLHTFVSVNVWYVFNLIHLNLYFLCVHVLYPSALSGSIFFCKALCNVVFLTLS